PHRPVEDLAFAVARFIQKGGSFVNYYMVRICMFHWSCTRIPIDNVGNHFETWNAGVLGPVTLEGLNEGKRDLSSQKWIYQALFNAPAGNEPLALDMSSMGKGQIWINGQSIGRYWPAYKAYGSCDPCDYRGTYNEKKCQSNCGEPSQKW
ncbi:hypothetical protein BHE74_00033564, partial [Ensete ventricosum]